VLDLKGVVEALSRALGVQLAVSQAQEPFLHPGRAGRLGDAGFLGELHPTVAEQFGIEATVSVFELDLDELARRAPQTVVYRDVISFPPVRQDIAVVVGDDVAAADVLAVVREAGGSLLADAGVFDVYRGPQVGEGRKSLAVHLVFQAEDRTLTDADADAARARIVAALADRLQGELRA